MGKWLNHLELFPIIFLKINPSVLSKNNGIQKQLNDFTISSVWHIISFGVEVLMFLSTTCLRPVIAEVTPALWKCIYWKNFSSAVFFLDLSSRCAVARTGWHLHLTPNPQPAARRVCSGFMCVYRDRNCCFFRCAAAKKVIFMDHVRCQN